LRGTFGQVLPPLMDVPLEARLNLVIYYLRNAETGDAFNLIKELEPTTPQEYILKAVVHASIGQVPKQPIRSILEVRNTSEARLTERFDTRSKKYKQSSINRTVRLSA
jgi:hypothetical protein